MPEQQTPFQFKTIADQKLDLLPMFRTMWRGRKTIFLCVLVGAILGIAVAMLSPKEYTAFTVMVPQQGGEGQSKLGGLGGLAAMAGISIDMSTGAELSPMIYPQIIGSAPFQLELMNTPLNFQDYRAPITLFDYYTKYSKPSVLGTIQKYTIGLPGVIIHAIKGSSKKLTLSGDSTNLPILMTEDQYEIKKALEGILMLEVNSKLGYLTLTIRMPEAIAAAQLANKAQALLQRYITNFKIEKAKANLDFIQGRYNDTKAEFEKAQVSLAVINDRNKSFMSGLPRIESDRIQTKYTIAFTVFQDLAKQLEQAKIQVKKDTPVFTIIQPVTVPLEKTKPKKPLIVIVSIFFGGFLGIGIVYGLKFVASIKRQWQKVINE